MYVFLKNYYIFIENFSLQLLIRMLLLKNFEKLLYTLYKIQFLFIYLRSFLKS